MSFGSGVRVVTTQSYVAGHVTTPGKMIEGHPRVRMRAGRREFVLAEENEAPGGAVVFTQRDVRSVQLAKGAIAAGFRILLERAGADIGKVKMLYLAGAFGNYVSRSSAQRIGLLDLPIDRVTPAGNTALRGAKLALFGLDGECGSYAPLRRKIEHVALKAEAKFQEMFVDHLAFPPHSEVRS